MKRKRVNCKKYGGKMDIVRDKSCEFYEECIATLNGKDDKKMKKKLTNNKKAKLLGLQTVDEIIDEMVKAGLSRKEILADLRIQVDSEEVEDSRKESCYVKILFEKAYYSGLRASFRMV